MDGIKDKRSILVDLQIREQDLSIKVAELNILNKELKEIRAAIVALGGVVDVASEYDKTLSWAEKIKYVLKTYGASSVTDIIDRIIEHEPERKKDPDAIKNNVTTVASNLAKNKEINAEKDGYRNIYSI